MIMVYENIVLVEEFDTAETIEKWLTEHTDVKAQNLDLDTWVHLVKYGDLLIFNSHFGMFRFSARVTHGQETL